MIAGEIGQTSIDYQGKDFVYGNKGALEAYVGIWHIVERAKEIYSSAGKMLSDEDALPHKLSAAADAGDPLALALWSDIGLKLGVGLSDSRQRRAAATQNRIIFPERRKKKPLRQWIAKQLLIINTCHRRQRRYRGIVH
jgi:hypothetical protein